MRQLDYWTMSIDPILQFEHTIGAAPRTPVTTRGVLEIHVANEHNQILVCLRRTRYNIDVTNLKLFPLEPSSPFDFSFMERTSFNFANYATAEPKLIQINQS